MIESIDVMLWGKKVGTLVASRSGYKNQICFYYDPEFIKRGLDIAPLRAPLSSIAAQSGMPFYPDEDKSFGGLPSFIADSMPDHWGNLVFNEWAKINHIRQKDISALDRLAYIGCRGMGALEFVPSADREMETSFVVEIANLSELAQTAIKDAKGFHRVLSPNLAIESLFKVGTSAGGRRPKAVINFNPINGECYSGQVAVDIPGFIPVIIKFDENSEIPSTRIEYSYYLMAQSVGLKMMPCRLLECNGETHFLTERFDRRHNGEKIHVQTLAAMSPTASSYEELFVVAQQIGIIPTEMQQMFLLMVMNVLAANVDDHNKNFSFLMDNDGEWHFAPTYDFTFTTDPSAPFYINRHSLTINGSDRSISREDLLAVAARYNIKGASGLIDKGIETVGKYCRYGEEAGVSDSWIQKITSEISGCLKEL